MLLAEGSIRAGQEAPDPKIPGGPDQAAGLSVTV
jgi:hypothetical protein